MTEDLADLEPFLAAYLNRLSPVQRRKVTRKVGEALRRENARRIAANVQPDGAAMEPRKKRKRMKDAKGRIKRQTRMFPKIKAARAIKIRATANDVSVGFEGTIGHTASVHHFGLEDFVGRTKTGKAIRTRYRARRLLGFGSGDIESITDAALHMLYP